MDSELCAGQKLHHNAQSLNTEIIRFILEKRPLLIIFPLACNRGTLPWRSSNFFQSFSVVYQIYSNMTDKDNHTHTASVSNPAVPKTFLAEGHNQTKYKCISVSQRVKLRSGHVSIDMNYSLWHGVIKTSCHGIFLYDVEIFCVGFYIILTEASLKINQVF